MNAAPIAGAKASADATSLDRLLQILDGYDDLGRLFREARAALTVSETACDIEAWDTAFRDLLAANVGASALRAFLGVSRAWPVDRAGIDLVALALCARAVGRKGGSAIAELVLTEIPRNLWRLPRSCDLAAVLDAFAIIARDAPESFSQVIVQLGGLLERVDGAGFAAWASDGLRAYGPNVSKRRAYFAGTDPLAWRLLSRHGTNNEFARLQRRLALGLKSLWNQQPQLEPIEGLREPATSQRVSIAAGVVRFPTGFAGFNRGRADDLYRAAAAHAGAHLIFSRIRFPIGKLKPVQIALVSLIEDARVETLAMREMPGLRRLWLPFHTAQPGRAMSAVALFARLSRALIDPSYRDDDAWVGKGRALFLDNSDRLADPSISREIGGLLGNDIGQMRLQFDARTYAAEPVYRDDNISLWEDADPPPTSADSTEAKLDGINVGLAGSDDKVAQNGRGHDPTPPPEFDTHTSSGISIASYPEWDYLLQRERPDWVTVLESEAPANIRLDGTTNLQDHPDLARRIAAAVRQMAIGQRARTRARLEGEVLDLDACISALIDRRVGLVPDGRIFEGDVTGARDLAVLLLLDLSQSTADVLGSGGSILSTEFAAADMIAASVEAAGDALALHGFSSNGRENVRYFRIKDFDIPFDGLIRARLAGLRSGDSTRLGSALRHAGSFLERRRAFRRVLLVMTDGEPSDVDVQDPVYLTEDARHATLSLRRAGIDTFAFGIGNGPFAALERVVGAPRALKVRRIDTLPERVVELYAALKR